MSKNVILAGKDYNKSSKIAVLAKQLGLNAFITTHFEKSDEKVSPSIYDWNRTSPVSAKSLIVNAENSFGTIDATILFFDTESFNRHFSNLSLQDATRCCDELILSYVYLTTEIIKRIERKNHGKLFFVLQGMQSASDFLKSSSREQISNPAHSSVLTSMAQSAFKSFAENIAASYYNQTSPSFIYLLEVNNEKNEQDIMEWINKKIEEENPIYKNSKIAVSWQSTEEKSKFSLPFLK